MSSDARKEFARMLVRLPVEDIMDLAEYLAVRVGGDAMESACDLVEWASGVLAAEEAADEDKGEDATE